MGGSKAVSLLALPIFAKIVKPVVAKIMEQA
jgi:hypothetical protein